MMSGNESGNPELSQAPSQTGPASFFVSVSSSVRWGWERTDGVAVKVQVPCD